MIFKTFDSDIDKWTSKIGIFGKSLNDIFEAKNQKKLDIDDLVTYKGMSLDEAKKQVGSFWGYLFPKKEDIKKQLIDVDKLIPKIDISNATEVTEKIKKMSESVANGEITWQKLFDILPDGEKQFAKLGQQMEGQIITTENVVKANQEARASAIAHNEAIKEQTLSAKAQSVALKAVSIAGNMILFTAITKGMQLVITAIDNYIHRVERARERTSELFDEFKSMNDTLTDHKKTVAELADRYDELSKGVNLFTNDNVSLSTKEYEEFLGINEQLADSFPELAKGIDENGNSILTLGTKGITAKEQLEELLQTEENLNNFRIAEGLGEAFNGVYTYIEDANEATETINESLNKTNEQIGILQDYIENGVDLKQDNYLLFKGDITDQAKTNYAYAMQSAEQEFLAGLDFERRMKVGELFTFVTDDLTGSFDFYANLYQLTPDEIASLEALISDNVSTLNGSLIDQFSTQEQELNNRVQQGENAWRDFIPNLVSGMRSKQTFKDLDSDLQDIAVHIIEGLDYSYADAIKSWNPNDPYAYIRDNIIVPIGQLSDSDKRLIKDSFTELMTLDAEDISKSNQEKIDELIETISDLLHKDQLEIRVALGFDVGYDTKERLENSIRSIADDHGIADREEFSILNEYTDKFTLSQVELWLEATLGAKNATEAIQKYEEALKSANNTAVGNNFTPTISSSVEQISKQLEPQFAKLGDAYASIFSDDGMDLNVVDNNMLESLRSSFADIEEELGVTFDSSLLNDFFDVLTDGNSTVDDVHDAFNDLATAYFYSTDTLEHLNEATAESIKQQLEQMGVVNSEEIIDHYLTLTEAENGLFELQEQLAEARKNLIESSNTGEYESAKGRLDLTYRQIEAYYNEKGVTDELRIALFNLQLQQANLNINSIDSSSSVSELLRLAEAAGLSAEYMEKLVYLQELFNRYESATNSNVKSAIYSNIQGVLSQIESGLKAPQLELEVDFPSSKDSKDAGKDAADEYMDAFNDEFNRLKFLRDNGIITEKEYLDQLRILYEKYFKDKEEYLKEYIEYEREYLKGLKNLYEDVLGGITDILDDQIDKIEEERDIKIDALEEEQEARKKALELQKDQLDLQIEEIEAQIKVKNDAIDAINDEIDAIKEANDERQRQIDLQKALYNLERMQNQRTILQYSEDKGMHYVNDTKGIRDAKQDVDDAKTNIEIANKEKQISLIEDEISLLETRKSLIQDQQADLDKQIDALDEYYKKLIENTEAYYSALIKPIEEYKAQFENIADIEKSAKFIEQLESLGYSVDDILSLNASTLENFKSNYLGILRDMYDDNTQMVDAIRQVSGLEGEFVGYLTQSQPYIDSLARLDLSSTQSAIDSANSGIHSFADGACIATTNITTMADTITSVLEGSKKKAGVINSLETMASVLLDANTQIEEITSGLDALDGKTVTVKVNIETSGNASLLSNAHADGTIGSKNLNANPQYGKAFAEGTGKYKGLPHDEKNALVSEYGQTEMTVLPNGKTIITDEPTMMDLPKDTVIFNEKQTKKIIGDKVNASGNAHADGTDGNWWIGSDGHRYRDLQPGDRAYELQKAFEPFVDKILKGEMDIISNAVFEGQKQMERWTKEITNNTAISNVNNNRNVQPIVNHINVTCPGVTEQQVAERIGSVLGKELDKQFNGFHNYADQMSRIR